MLYEVPYNFDETLVKYYVKNKEYIKFLYLPPYKDDSVNTRTFLQTNEIGRCYMPQSRDEYESHLKKIHESGLRYVVLWQDRNHEISTNLIDYYYSLHASGFIVASDNNAKIIKSHKQDLLVVCSIVQRTCDKILSKDFSYYDYIILFFPFNRSLDILKRLSHLRSKLVLMPNSCCDVECSAMHHWFPKNDRPFDPEKDCSMNIKNIHRCGVILPQHLSLFDEYVGGYKLQGREWTTETIKYLCHFYFKRTIYADFVDPFLGREQTDKLMELISITPLEVYYNSKTQDLMKRL